MNARQRERRRARKQAHASACATQCGSAQDRLIGILRAKNQHYAGQPVPVYWANWKW